MPGWSAMQQNHCPPSLTIVVPGATRAHSRLVSAVWKPRTTCRRAYRGRRSAEVSTAIKGGVAAPTAPGALPGAPPANIGIVDLDPWPARAKLIAAVPLDHCLH